MPNYTQLQLAIAKMLPEELGESISGNKIYWIKRAACGLPIPYVLPTEWEHIVGLVEETLIKSQETAGSDMTNPDYALWTRYISYLRDVCGKGYCSHVHASWQQRATVIVKVKGVEI